MRFVDEVTIHVKAGDGGNGCVAFRREKFVPRGGPSGGNGGDGGDVVLRADPRLGTLLELRYRPTIRARRGEHGQGSDMYGRGASSEAVLVPVGTVVFDAQTGELLADLDRDGATFVAARGGRGGRGNMHFATPWNQAPRKAEKGATGEERELRLELKLLADVGIVGLPNVGKSTLISRLSAARPKIADYPFTTLTPNLGVVRVGEGQSFVLADIPGLVPGASQGVGLGTRFLKHVERTRALLHLLALRPGEESDPVADMDATNLELAAHDEALAKRPQLVALNKADLAETRAAQGQIARRLSERGIELHLVSSATGEGLDRLTYRLWDLLRPQEESPSDGG